MKYNCLFCNKEFNGDKNRKFCSCRCSGDFKRKLWFEKGNVGYRSIKKFLIQTQGHKCSQCNLTEWLGQEIPLVLDHINGDAENNKVENCRLLCCHCDALTPTYKGRNRGKGRYSRRMRYRNNQSY